MKYYGRAEAVAEKIVEAFKTGNIPKALWPPPHIGWINYFYAGRKIDIPVGDSQV